MAWMILLGLGGVITAVMVTRHFWKKADDSSDRGVILLLGCTIGLGGTFILLAVVAHLTTGVMPDYSIGERIGYVTKLSQKGVVFKTYEGQLQVGQGEQVAVQQPFDFSVRDPEVLRKLREAMTGGNKVVLHYREWFLMPARIGASAYEVTSVELIE